MKYGEISVAFSGIKNDLVAEELEQTARVLHEQLEARGLIRDGQLASVTEDGQVFFGDELEEGVMVEDASTFLQAAVDQMMSEFDIDEDEAYSAVGAFLDQATEEGMLPEFPEDGDVEGDAKWLDAAISMNFIDEMLNWASDDGEEEEGEDD
jgi:hypothetical protein